MTHDITLSTVLEHIQAMKYDLQTQIGSLGNRITGVEAGLKNLRVEMIQGFEEARQHRQALQEDLDATIRMQGKHETAITRLARKNR